MKILTLSDKSEYLITEKEAGMILKAMMSGHVTPFYVPRLQLCATTYSSPKIVPIPGQRLFGEPWLITSPGGIQERAFLVGKTFYKIYGEDFTTFIDEKEKMERSGWKTVKEDEFYDKIAEKELIQWPNTTTLKLIGNKAIKGPTTRQIE
jgi:hypothetical protein